VRSTHDRWLSEANEGNVPDRRTSVHPDLILQISTVEKYLRTSSNDIQKSPSEELFGDSSPLRAGVQVSE